MSVQTTDIYGVADYLGLTVTTVRRRIKAGKFPTPDAIEHETEWWELATLEKYQRSLKRRQARKRKTTS